MTCPLLETSIIFHVLPTMSYHSHLSPPEAVSRRNSVASTRRDSAASNFRPVSPYHELRMWDPEEDIIQLNTPRLSASNLNFTIEGKPLNLASASRRTSVASNNNSFVRPSRSWCVSADRERNRRLITQPSLIDIDDHIPGKEADRQLAERFQEQWKGYNDTRLQAQ